jgi:pimeloyl-ACP methyl ester carboxylesterase
VPKMRVRDLDMYYEIHGRSGAEPLVLLHGFTGTGNETFGSFLGQLGEDYRLFVPDMRGHGRTTNPRGEILHSELARDTGAFASALGLDHAHFCGHSSGGMHLLFLALEHPELVHSLTLVSATYTFDDRVKAKAREIRASAPTEWIDSLKALHGESHGTDYGDTILDLWLSSVLRPDELPFNPVDLSEIACPTLIIHGDRDLFFPVHVPTTMYEAIPHSELCILPNCGHGLLLDSPTLFATALLEFLSRNPFENSIC